MKRIAIAALILVAIACTDSDGAKRVLEAQGYTDVKITGWAPFQCGRDDGTCTGFEAASPGGKRVKGAVSGSLVGCKGHTIRLE